MTQPEAATMTATKAKIIAGLNGLNTQYRTQLALLMLIKSSYFIAQISCFWLFSSMVHQLIVEQASYATQQLNLFGYSAIFWLVFRHFGQHHELSFNRQIKRHLHQQVHQKLAERQHALAQQHSSFQWQQVFLQHIPAVAAYVSQYQVQKYLSALIPLFALIMVFSVNWFVATILLFTLPLIPVFMILVGHGAANIHRKHFLSLERLGGLFIDRLKALTTVTAFNQHKNQSTLLDSASRLVNQQTMKVVSVAFLSTTVLDFFATVSMALVAVFIGFSLLGELSLGPEMTLQHGLFLLLLAPLLFSELKTLGRLYHQKAEAEAAWESLEPIANSAPISRVNGVFQGVDWLNFHLEQPQLLAPKLHLKAGQSVYLKGQSGAGKSVFLQGLMGLRAASHQLTGQCVFLGQSAIVLPTSVRENLTLGHQINEHRLWLVLKQVALDHVVNELPEGIHTRLGEHPPLSGGELQRLMLARVLLQSGDVILLDEPTAHLPEQQHQELSQLIYRLTRGKTLIWASHKALPTEWFDHTWQIDQGVIETRSKSVEGVNHD